MHYGSVNVQRMERDSFLKLNSLAMMSKEEQQATVSTNFIVD